MVKKKHRQQRKDWQPLSIGPPSQEYVEGLIARFRAVGHPDPESDVPTLIGINDTYSVVVREKAHGLRHLSIHRLDRRPIRDWRHLQQIKSEMLGPGAVAVEVFPPDDRIFDTSNEYHLWEITTDLYDSGAWANFEKAIVPAHVHNEGRVRGLHKGRQRPLQPGLSAFEEQA